MSISVIKTIIIVIISLILLCFVKILYSKIFKKNKQLHTKFAKTVIQAIIIIVGIYFAGSQFEVFKSFSDTLLTSTSLLVVVLGFALQTSLEDFIAGVLISLFKPFNIGDRVFLVNQNISGYIENMTIRHTIIRTFNNSRLIIPNSIMNKEIVENNHIVDERSTGFMDVVITYDSNVDLAKKIMADVISSHKNVLDTRTQEQKDNNIPQVSVLIRELGSNGIHLRATITTANIDLNFTTCSDIRESLLKQFKINNIEFAFPHTEVSGKVKLTK